MGGIGTCPVAVAFGLMLVETNLNNHNLLLIVNMAILI